VPKVALAFVVLAVMTGAASAQQFTYKIHTEVRTLQSDPIDSPLDKVIDEAGRDLRHAVLSDIKDGVADFSITISDQAVRIEHASDGMVEIVRADQDTTIVNTATHTYWSLPHRRPTTSLPGLSARLSWKRTGEFEVIAGVQAERTLFEIAMLPADQRFAKILGEPVMFSAQGEVWIAPQYRHYARLAAGLAPQAVSLFPPLAELADHGAIMRSIIVSELLGPVEIESTVTHISERTLDASLYDVPSGYHRVPAPPVAGFEPPQLVSRSPANYTAEATRNRIDGVVLLLVTIAADGSVRNPRVLQGLGYGLDEQAAKSVLQWRYKPARRNGQAIDSDITISIGFTYRERVR
jgi:TonB family protein